MSVARRVHAIGRFRAVRLFSTSTDSNAVQILDGEEKIEAFRKHVQKAPMNALKMGVVFGSSAPQHLPKNQTELSVFSAMPEVQSQRTVLIAERHNKTLQSGGGTDHQWQITWKHQKRWSNPLMGWTSSSDPMSHVKLDFNTKEEAIQFAEKQGWTYEVARTNSKRNLGAGTYQYKHNFLSIKTGGEVSAMGNKTKEFIAPGWGQSNWFQYLKYHGDGEVVQHGPPAAAAK